MPETKVKGHFGKLVLGQIENKKVNIFYTIFFSYI